MSAEEVRARVRAWPTELADRFETVAAEWLADADARLAAQLLDELLADVLAVLDVVLDLDDLATAKLEALLKSCDTLEDVMPDQPSRPDRPIPRSAADVVAADWEREEEWVPGVAGRAATPKRRPRPTEVRRTWAPPLPPWHADFREDR